MARMLWKLARLVTAAGIASAVAAPAAPAADGARLLQAAADAAASAPYMTGIKRAYAPMAGPAGFSCLPAKRCDAFFEYQTVIRTGTEQDVFTQRLQSDAKGVRTAQPALQDYRASDPGGAAQSGSFRFTGSAGRCYERLPDFTAAQLAALRRPDVISDVLRLAPRPVATLGTWAHGKRLTFALRRRGLPLSVVVKLDEHGRPVSGRMRPAHRQPGPSYSWVVDYTYRYFEDGQSGRPAAPLPQPVCP